MTCVNDILIKDLKAEIAAFKQTMVPGDKEAIKQLRRLEGRLGTLKLQAGVP